MATRTKKTGKTTGTKGTAPGNGAACAAIKCPLAGQGDGAACRDCPGPDYFARHHECDKCRFHGRGDARCVICPGPPDDPSHKGASHVSLDAMPDGGERTLGRRIDTSEAHALSGMTDGEAEAARRVMCFFVGLEADEFALVKYLVVSGGNLNTYAAVNNRTRQDVWKMAKAMMRRSPEIRAIVRERKQPNGRVLGPRAGNPLQLSLF